MYLFIYHFAHDLVLVIIILVVITIVIVLVRGVHSNYIAMLQWFTSKARTNRIPSYAYWR